MRFGDTRILIAQPYGDIDRKLVLELATEYCLRFIIADKWSFYWPGKTGLLILEATNETKKISRRKLQFFQPLPKKVKKYYKQHNKISLKINDIFILFIIRSYDLNI